MNCACGHALADHSDRAVFPACEGTHSDVGPLLVIGEWEGRETYSIRPVPISRNPACDCKGFQVV